MEDVRALILWASSHWPFKHSLACHEFSFVKYHSLLMCHFVDGHYTLAQPIESFTTPNVAKYNPNWTKWI